ncbi:MAG: DUF4038 domain-containing protein [Clostridia bacterium]|nr:DUF4038 domain-containing protein [Clostridia bacterium]
MNTQTWLANELAFHSSVTYANPFEDVDLDVIFTCGDTCMTVPAFWDGGNLWRTRFSLPAPGLWSWEARCTNPGDAGLCGSGSIRCTEYDGELAIYRRGFIKTTPGVRYFTYADGTPFFYLGDTHWNFAMEEFDEPGDHAGDIDCTSHFCHIVNRRAEQGFTVYQSEPIGAKYDLSEGLDENDIEGFRDLDRRFACIASKGLVHANAQLVFPSTLVQFARYDDAAYLRRLGRYWAARYSAYPVLWTLGQEVDNDFYYTRGDQKRFTGGTNPYKLIAEGLHQNDPHAHPMTAHMEFCFMNPQPGPDGTCASTSSFRNVDGHTWYGFQWGRNLNTPISYDFAKDAMLNGQGKVCILYESKYDYLWTKHFGARSEGWLGLLNGFYGYGYGCIDMWYYKSTYDIHSTSSDGVDTITPEDKQVPWSKSLEFETAYQVNYMREFLQKLEWWKLIPRFDSPLYFVPDGESYHAIATDERETIVLYFCNPDHATGRLTCLDDSDYHYRWFNPRSGEYLPERTFHPDAHHSWKAELKPDKADWVLLVQKIV